MFSTTGSLCRGAAQSCHRIQSLSSWTKKTPFRNVIRVTDAAINVVCGLLCAGFALGLTKKFKPDSNIKIDPDISVMVLPSPLTSGEKKSYGTGFNYDGGHIVTVNHLLTGKKRGGSPDSIVAYSKKDFFHAKKIGFDEENDIAVYKIEGSKKYFDKSFQDIPFEEDKKWSISFLESNISVGVDFYGDDGSNEFDIKSEYDNASEINDFFKEKSDFCFIKIYTPKRCCCIGWIGVTPGYSGAPVFSERDPECRSVGMVSYGLYPLILGKNYAFSMSHIRSGIIHKSVGSIIKNEQENSS